MKQWRADNFKQTSLASACRGQLRLGVDRLALRHELGIARALQIALLRFIEVRFVSADEISASVLLELCIGLVAGLVGTSCILGPHQIRADKHQVTQLFLGSAQLQVDIFGLSLEAAFFASLGDAYPEHTPALQRCNSQQQRAQ